MMGPTGQGTCRTNLEIVVSLCELLGVPLASEKTMGPCTCLDYIGFLLDTIAMEVRETRPASLRNKGMEIQEILHQTCPL